MAQLQGGKKKSGNRKHGRDKTKSERYVRENRREKNKARRLAKLQRKFAKNKARINEKGHRADTG